MSVEDNSCYYVINGWNLLIFTIFGFYQLFLKMLHGQTVYFIFVVLKFLLLMVLVILVLSITNHCFFRINPQLVKWIWWFLTIKTTRLELLLINLWTNLLWLASAVCKTIFKTVILSLNVKITVICPDRFSPMTWGA